MEFPRCLVGCHQRQHRAASAAFTLMELLVVVVIIAILTSILLPGVRIVRDKAQGAKCGSNLRQVGMGFMSYAIDNEGYLPNSVNTLTGTTYRWTELIALYVEASKNNNGVYSTSLRLTNSVLAGCPIYHPATGLAAWDVGFGMSAQLGLPSNINSCDTRDIPFGKYQMFVLGTLDRSTSRALAADSTSHTVQTNFTIASNAVRHQNRLTTLFCDMHVTPVLVTDYILSVTNPVAYVP